MFTLLRATEMAGCESLSARVRESKLTVDEDLNEAVLIPCSICQRTFKSESLQKHQGVCLKNANKKRKVFDSMKQRIQGTELAEYIPIPAVIPKPKIVPVNKPVSDKTVRDANSPLELQHVGNDVKPASTSEKPQCNTRSRSLGSHLRGAFKEERCPHCDRTFSWKAFSRHEEWCKEHKSRVAQSPAAVLKAKEMLDARIKYRAPALGRVKRPTNREKYAGGAHPSPGVESSHSSIEIHPRSSHTTPKTHAAGHSMGSNRNVVASKVSSPNIHGGRGDHHGVSSLDQSSPVSSRRLPHKKLNSIHLYPFKEKQNDEPKAEPPLTKHSPYESTYDPFCKAKMQLKELLSDEIGLNKPIHESSYPVQSSENGTHVQPDYVTSRKNGNVHGIPEINSNQNQAKEVELPDMFTETSMQLDFEMPNLIRGRDVSLHTKRRSMKPTAQNMGIELNPVRDGFVEREDSPNSKISGPNARNFGNQDCDNISSVMDMGLIQDKYAKSNSSQKLDVDSLHESINIVALELANLSTNSSESMFDMDNNDCSLEMKAREQMDTAAVNSLRDSLENEEAVTEPKVSHDGEKLVCGESRLEGNFWRSSSPEALVGVHLQVSGKHLVDSAYSSLSRATLPTSKEGAADKGTYIHLAYPGEEHDDDLASKKILKQEQQEINEPHYDFKLAKFCHDCGSRYPLTEAKFCCACGARRLVL